MIHTDRGTYLNTYDRKPLSYYALSLLSICQLNGIVYTYTAQYPPPPKFATGVSVFELEQWNADLRYSCC